MTVAPDGHSSRIDEVHVDWRKVVNVVGPMVTLVRTRSVKVSCDVIGLSGSELERRVSIVGSGREALYRGRTRVTLLGCCPLYTLLSGSVEGGGVGGGSGSVNDECGKNRRLSGSIWRGGSVDAVLGGSGVILRCGGSSER